MTIISVSDTIVNDMERIGEQFSQYLTRDKQRQRTLSDILSFIMERGCVTRREIERDTGFSWGVVSASVAELIQRGYVVERAQAVRTIGRQSAVLEPCGDRVVAIGVDVNTTALGVRVVGFDLSCRWAKERPFTAKTQSELISDVFALIEEALGTVKDKQVIGVGVAMQGYVDADSGTSIYFSGVSWQPIKLAALIEERFGVRAVIEHDPRCMLIARCVRQKLKNAILLRVDNGIGLAVVQDGAVLRDGGRLEIGHTVAERGGELCSCGRRGCLEAYSSIRGIEQRTGKGYEELVGSGEVRAFRTAGDYLATAIYNLCALFAPERVVVTGKLAQNAIFCDAIRRGCEPLLDDCTEIEIDHEISASFGAAVVAVRSAITKNEI